MPKVLVLGGEGMVGRTVATLLAQSPACYVESTSRGGGLCHRLDARDPPETLRAVVQACGRVQYLVNCIGMLKSRIALDRLDSVRDAAMINAVFPWDVAAVAGDAGARVLHISTDGVFSGQTGGPYTEESPTDAADIYGASKRLGEVAAPHVLNLRCSIVGMDPLNGRGLLAWFLAQPDGGAIDGFVDQPWNGVTTLQLAEACAAIVSRGVFDRMRDEGSAHHFCPNETLTKYDLLRLFNDVWRRSMAIRPATSDIGAGCRVLATIRKTLPTLFGRERSMRAALLELARGVPKEYHA